MSTLSSPPKLSRYFSWPEVTKSNVAERKGIVNSLPLALVPNAVYTANKMDEVRLLLNRPVLVDSWYRSLELNRFLGSKDNSAHRQALACDFICPEYGLPFEVAKYLVKFADKLQFDQLILEHTWIHIGFSQTNPRKQILSLLANGYYAGGLTNNVGTRY